MKIAEICSDMGDQPSAVPDASAYAPKLPPLIASSREKSMDQLVADFQQTPLFMTELPKDDEENVAIEALKALQSDSNPLDSAQDFKDQGNEYFQAKIWSNAREQYTKGIDILSLEERKRLLLAEKATGRERGPGLGDQARNGADGQTAPDPDPGGERSRQRKLLETLYVNRAATHLELKNYRSATADCAAALRLNPNNVKAYYRSGRALLAVSRIAEADDSCARGLSLDSENTVLKALASQIIAKVEEVSKKNKAVAERETREQHKAMVLRAALRARNIQTRTTDRPPNTEDARVKLVPDEHSPTSSLCFPVLILYPAHLESDFIKEFLEEQSITDHLDYVFPLPWDEKGEYGMDNVECYMDTVSGGLVKVGKKVPLLKVLGSGKVEIVDGVVKLFVIPKAKAEAWVKEYMEKRAVELMDERNKKAAEK